MKKFRNAVFNALHGLILKKLIEENKGILKLINLKNLQKSAT